MPYAAASPADLKMRYPEFADTDDARIQYWLDDARNRIVLDDEWNGPDAPVAQMLVAAHNLSMQGEGADASEIPANVTAMRSGSLSLNFDTDGVRNAASGGWAATRYGAQFLALLNLRSGGTRTTASGMVPLCAGYGLSGLHPSW